MHTIYYACTRGLFNHEDVWRFNTIKEAIDWIVENFDGEGYIKTEAEIFPKSKFEEEKILNEKFLRLYKNN